VGFDETECEIVSPVECLHIFLAPSVTAASALADFDIDPEGHRSFLTDT
jgi:AraC family transcriptional regulator